MNKKIKDFVLDVAKKTIILEIKSLENLPEYCDERFAEVVHLISKSKGRLIVTGIGKSAIIGQKIVATLNSTGTPAIFMHAADAIHGDLGIVQEHDIVLCISKSGNTPEIKVLIPLIKRLGNTLIGMVSDISSFLATEADYVIKATVAHEACPNNLAPTSSTTAQLVMGDAMAVCLLELKGFTTEDFARYHPGGSIGRKLYMRVSELCKQNQVPKVSIHDKVDVIIMEMTSKLLGATAVIDNNENLVGIITDGDLRRMLQKNLAVISELTAQDIMSRNPKTIDESELAVKALRILEENSITQIIVTSRSNYLGMVHLHDLIREGVV
ncbi:MAG: KpsF/GutQ family sugar-phosphate isomerase [Bacteroidales bacterium]|nr:KpsF/GutQ family sugar-phosphate isomerase [Bacteroidales bacterium]HOY38620.1 KpsF/GutQ family sugar-phosphate isomerase [Bacteroidales bacterium]HQP04586.1 KpsF/GutQ family sugar-phosphate isomerase [Bacteroidales bacterium]